MKPTDAERERFARDGYFVRRRFVDPSVGEAIEREIVDAIRADPPSAHADAPVYRAAGHLFIQPERKRVDGARNPEDLISKVFNPHLAGRSDVFARDEATAAVVTDLIGAPASVFQSQFIFKNPGAWGQPWHQDAHYFPFDRRPEIGVWLAISEATLENGCLAVLPGGHLDGRIHRHGPDLRPGANLGYLEIEGLPEDEAVPVLMEPGDCLFFHSLLPHRSFDNRATTRRSALVCHYADRDTVVSPDIAPAQKAVFHWRPVGAAA